MTAKEQYTLALQAARGLYQAQLYKGGKATHVHADVKPPQFLLFDRPATSDNTNSNDGDESSTLDNLPIMQINDFNRGKFLTRSIQTKNTCPFHMCNVHHKGSTYRAPEELLRCSDDDESVAAQDDTIDVYSLGGVFFYLLSDGKKPYYHIGSYDKAAKLILSGEKPRLPDVTKEYSSYDDEIVEMVKRRSKHPLFIALKGIMIKCWAFKPSDRPSSFEVVQMLEEKWNEIEFS